MYYLVTLDSNPQKPHYIICKGFRQYQEETSNTGALYQYTDYITVRRIIKNISAVELLYDLVPSQKALCAGKPIEPVIQINPGARSFEISLLKDSKPAPVVV